MGEAISAIANGFVVLMETVLRFFYSLPPHSAGLSIIFFTIAVKIVLMPLTISQLRASREMQKLQPQLKELQKKYAKDREKLQQETMALYRQHGVNPTQGCLPSLLQLPIFLGVYYAILNLTRIPTVGTLLGRLAGFESLALLGLAQIPADVATGLTRGIFAGESFLWMSTLGKPDALHILPILAGLLQVVQQKMMTSKDADPQQQAMNNAMMFMPLMIVFIGWTFPAGAVIYWVTQSLVGIVQQYITSGWGGLRQWLPFLPERKQEEKKPRRKSAEEPSKPAPQQRGWFWRMMDRMSEMQQEAATKQGPGTEPEEALPPTAGAPPPAPSKRRSRR